MSVSRGRRASSVFLTKRVIDSDESDTQMSDKPVQPSAAVELDDDDMVPEPRDSADDTQCKQGRLQRGAWDSLSEDDAPKADDGKEVEEKSSSSCSDCEIVSPPAPAKKAAPAPKPSTKKKLARRDSFIVSDDAESDCDADQPRRAVKFSSPASPPRPAFRTRHISSGSDSDAENNINENREPTTPAPSTKGKSWTPCTPKAQAGFDWTTDADACTPRGGPKTINTPSRALPYTTPKPKAALISFAKRRDELTVQWYARYNKEVFESKLPADMKVEWSKKLNKTAGITHLRRMGATRWADIELSTKVVDTEDKLRNTLCHEMCHAAAFLINGVSKPPHGDVFKAWGVRAMRVFRDLSIQTCHTYDINYKYTYVCLGEDCGHRFGRHSKSIDVTRQRCGACHGALILEPRIRADGTPAAARTGGKFAAFVKEHFARTKAGMPGAAHGDIMRELGTRFRAGLDLGQATEVLTDLGNVN